MKLGYFAGKLLGRKREEMLEYKGPRISLRRRVFMQDARNFGDQLRNYLKDQDRDVTFDTSGKTIEMAGIAALIGAELEHLSRGYTIRLENMSEENKARLQLTKEDGLFENPQRFLSITRGDNPGTFP